MEVQLSCKFLCQVQYLLNFFDFAKVNFRLRFESDVFRKKKEMASLRENLLSSFEQVRSAEDEKRRRGEEEPLADPQQFFTGKLYVLMPQLKLPAEELLWSGLSRPTSAS